MKTTYIADVNDHGEDDVPSGAQFHDGRPVGDGYAVGDEGVRVLYGNRDGLTCIVDADDAEDAERRILATFGDAASIEDLHRRDNDGGTAGRYELTIPAMDPDALPRDLGVNVFVHDDEREVTLSADDPDALLAYVRQNGWDEDEEWLEGLRDRILDAGGEGRRYLVARFDVTDLSEAQTAALVGEVTVQAEVSDDHPSVEVTTSLDDVAGAVREILIHLNVEVPPTDRRTADEIAVALLGALEVGSDDDSVRDLKVVAPLAEEV